MDSNYKRKLVRAKLLINQIKEGNDPINNIQISNDSFLKDKKIYNLFSFVDELLDKEIYSMLPKVDFYITAKEINDLKYPADKTTISVTDFTNIVNETIRLKDRKKLRPTQVNTVLRELNEIKYEIINDKKRNRATDLGKKHGILEKTSNYNGTEYFYVCYGEIGFKHLKDILLEYFCEDDF